MELAKVFSKDLAPTFAIWGTSKGVACLMQTWDVMLRLLREIFEMKWEAMADMAGHPGRAVAVVVAVAVAVATGRGALLSGHLLQTYLHA